MIQKSKRQIFVIGFSMLLLGLSINVLQATAKTPKLGTEKNIEIKWGKPTAGVVCAVALKQPSNEHNVDQPIRVNLHIKNTGSKEVGFVITNLLSMLEFHLVGPNKKTVPFTLNGKIENSSTQARCYLKIMKSGAAEVVFNSFWLNHYFDMTLPGTYQVSFKQKISFLDKNNSVTVTVISNKLQIKVIESSKSLPKLKLGKSEIRWGKPKEKIACAVRTNVKENFFNKNSPLWINLHTKSGKGRQKSGNLEGEYEISVMSPHHELDLLSKGNWDFIVYSKGEWHPLPLTLYGLQKNKSKNKSSLHIRLKPKEKEDFVRLHLNRYFDMTLFPEDGYQVSFKRKLKFPKQNKTVRVQSNKLIIKNTGDVKPEKKKTDLN